MYDSTSPSGTGSFMVSSFAPWLPVGFLEFGNFHRPGVSRRRGATGDPAGWQYRWHWKDLVPFFKRSVGRQDPGLAFVAAIDHFVEDVGSLIVEGEIGTLIDA
jgi:hypothetical protein